METSEKVAGRTSCPFCGKKWMDNTAANLLAENTALREAALVMIQWDEAEKTALPYDDDGGAAFRERIQLCDKAFTMLRAALALHKPKSG